MIWRGGSFVVELLLRSCCVGGYCDCWLDPLQCRGLNGVEGRFACVFLLGFACCVVGVEIVGSGSQPSLG